MKGNGTYDAAAGVENPRIEVTLATGISTEHCALINLGYKDPATVDARDFEGDARTLVIPRAGEMLYRVRPTLRSALRERQADVRSAGLQASPGR